MIYIVGVLLVAMIFLRQGAPVVWPVSAGAPEPAFSEYSRSFRAWVELHKRLYPIANWLVLALLICAAITGWMSYQTVAIVFWAVGCGGYISLFVFFEFSKPSSANLY
jgi:hypothetical protein